MNLIGFSRSRNCVDTQYAALSGAMIIQTNYHRNKLNVKQKQQKLTKHSFEFIEIYFTWHQL